MMIIVCCQIGLHVHDLAVRCVKGFVMTGNTEIHRLFVQLPCKIRGMGVMTGKTAPLGLHPSMLHLDTVKPVLLVSVTAEAEILRPLSGEVEPEIGRMGVMAVYAAGLDRHMDKLLRQGIFFIGMTGSAEIIDISAQHPRVA